MSHRRPVSSDRRPAKRGFALLLTITLLAFIILLLVGLATYTRVETAIAGNMQRQAQARENALFALNVALGQLQAQAGPDQRVTATAAGSSNPYWTGAWKTDPADPNYTTPAWLVSGLESATAPNPAVTLSTTDDTNVRLVGNKTVSSTSEQVWVKKLTITAPGVPGQTGSATIGRYGWWVGDQGVKAPVAQTDGSGAVDFAPYDSADLRTRIRQQISLGAGAADTAGAAVFEPRDTSGSPSSAALAANLTISNQLAFLHPAGSSSGTIGFATTQKNFHAWSPNNFAIIANSKDGGLRQDLSLKPELLGVAYSAWADYPSYMEDPFAAASSSSTGGSSSVGSTTTSSSAVLPIAPAYGPDPLRRRYIMTPHVIDGNGSHQVGPVLTYFLITFNVRTVGGSASPNGAMEVRARWMATLWNPYSGALVPEDLQLEVSGLPRSVSVVNENSGATAGSFTLSSNLSPFGSPLLISLPWASLKTMPSNAVAEDFQSWLPGRVYTWRSAEDKTGNLPAAGYVSDFCSTKLDDAGEGVIRPLTGFTVPDATEEYHLDVNGSANLSINIYANRSSGRVRVGGLVGPPFQASFFTDKQKASDGTYQFGYVFRLNESLDTPAAPGTWLTTDGRDVRRRTVPEEAYGVAEKGDNPAQYGGNYKQIDSPDRLLDRAETSHTYNEDVPLFELPRAPLLSVGGLQHFRLVGRRPFMVGNAWGAGETLNNVPLVEFFDRFYFSGLVAGVTPSSTLSGDMVMPNPLLKPLRVTSGAKLTIDDVRGLTDAYSSKYFLQSGAFNLNSVSPVAWAAVLRGVRFPDPTKFNYLDADSNTGSNDDSKLISVSSTDAQFFRFSQSAQETFKAESGNSGGIAATELFRRGMCSLSGAKVAMLATKIAGAVNARLSNTDPTLPSGPFRSLEEFLSPINSGPSLLEQAIADANINVDANGNPIEFSSQYLTQADIMTALAPVLYARSDTFVIRTYGEALNPTTSAVEGRAWCEAIVQRTPDYIDPSDPPETLPPAFDVPVDPTNPLSTPTQAHQLNKLLGRRFKVVSFRWLTRSDI